MKAADVSSGAQKSVAGNVKSSPCSAGAKSTDYLAIARESYGPALPDWVEELAKLAAATTGVHAAKRIGLSSSVVTAVCRAKYNGDLAGVEARVRGALMGVVVDCPVLGEIGKDRCLGEQRKRHIGASATRTALYHKCRSGDCPHSRLKPAGGQDAA